MIDGRVVQTMDDLELLAGWLRAHPGYRFQLESDGLGMAASVVDRYGNGIAVAQEFTTAAAVHGLVVMLVRMP